MTPADRWFRRAFRPGLLLLAGLLFLATAARSQGRADPLRGLDRYIEQAMRRWDLPGLAIGIVKDDSLVYARGFGVRERGKPGKVDENTLFAVASNTKAVTATALGLLVAEGKVSWDAPVTRYLPWFQLRDPWVTREATVRDLLTHRMGYGTWQGDLLWYGSTYDTREALRRWRYVEPVRSFRSGYGYTNHGFNAAGEIIADESGMSWADFVRQRLLEPLGMTRTRTSTADLAAMDDVAMPHTRIGDSIVVLPYRRLDNAQGAAGLNSSVRDWAQWLRLQLAYGRWQGRQLVDSAVIRETRTPQMILPFGGWSRAHFPSTHFSAYGLGWFLRDYRGRMIVMHSGGMDGMLSQTAFLPEENLGVVIFTNSDDQSLYAALLFRVIDLYLGPPVQDWSGIYYERDHGGGPAAEPVRVAGTSTTVPLEAFVGSYRNAVLGEASVTLNRDTLWMALPAHPGLVGWLEHWNYDAFRAHWKDRYLGTSLIPFTLDERGRPVTFTVSVRPDFVDPMEYRFER
ncbi:MAG: serine hydrolase [Gemmatimonadales bacterium]